MLKVLSTKLKVDEIDRFAEMAEQQGESKSGLLRRLVLEYLNSCSKADGAASTGTCNPAKSSKKGLLSKKTNGDDGLALSQSPSPVKPFSSEGIHSRDLVSAHRQRQASSPAPTPNGNISLRNVENVDYYSDSLSSSQDSIPVYHIHSKGRPETSAKPSTSKGWLLLLVLLVLWLNSRSSIAVDRKSAFTTQSPRADEHRLYTYRVGNTTVYSSSPIPFW